MRIERNDGGHGHRHNLFMQTNRSTASTDHALCPCFCRARKISSSFAVDYRFRSHAFVCRFAKSIQRWREVRVSVAAFVPCLAHFAHRVHVSYKKTRDEPSHNAHRAFGIWSSPSGALAHFDFFFGPIFSLLFLRCVRCLHFLLRPNDGVACCACLCACVYRSISPSSNTAATRFAPLTTAATKTHTHTYTHQHQHEDSRTRKQRERKKSKSGSAPISRSNRSRRKRWQLQFRSRSLRTQETRSAQKAKKFPLLTLKETKSEEREKPRQLVRSSFYTFLVRNSGEGKIPDDTHTQKKRKNNFDRRNRKCAFSDVIQFSNDFVKSKVKCKIQNSVS